LLPKPKFIGSFSGILLSFIRFWKEVLEIDATPACCNPNPAGALDPTGVTPNPASAPNNVVAPNNAFAPNTCIILII
jgi:hypothetical protein